VKRQLLKIAERAGLAPLAFSLYEHWQAIRGGKAAGPGGQILPPARLRVKVAGTANPEHFWDGGQKAVATLRALLASQGLAVEDCSPLLEFGCGCGRVLLHWNDIADVHGCDYNSELVAWCSAHLHGARVVRNDLAPPLPFGAKQFGLVYALSVFTHLPEDLAQSWMTELSRVLAPGGLLAFSTHGDHYLPILDEGERLTYLSGEPVVRFRKSAGANLCNAYHPRAYVEKTLAKDLDLLAFQPRGARGNPEQDLWLFRKPIATK
jgi:SAM-dependent methyltransferase